MLSKLYKIINAECNKEQQDKTVKVVNKILENKTLETKQNQQKNHNSHNYFKSVYEMERKREKTKHIGQSWMETVSYMQKQLERSFQKKNTS